MDSGNYLKDILDLNLLDKENLQKLEALENNHILEIINEYVALCKPSKVTIITDSQEDVDYVRYKSIEKSEEIKLSIEGHSVHYDAFINMGNHDQARDKANTKVLIPAGQYKSPWINTIDRKKGLTEILDIMDGCMKDHECIIRFFCLGPKDSKFSLLALQLTDSFYVCHSEDILYRSGYEEFKKLNGSKDFFSFIHSSGELIGNPPVTKNLDNRRIYVDLQEGKVLTVNNQYAGNSLGLKKLALRLAIHKSNNEDWLAEHDFILGVHPKGKNRISYFCGAYPSACGKTSTAMLPNQTIVGDDVAYLRPWSDGYAHAVNIEQGIFGIIKDVNPKDDPVIWGAITTPRETIFSNVLVLNKKPYWLGDGRDVPEEGMNFSGNWSKNKKDDDNRNIPHAHPNARYTIRIEELSNADKNLHNPDGVPLEGIFYGGRDSDTMPPVLESFNWEHGVFLGASIESETTSATIGMEGVRKASPMANLDFIVVPLSKYLENHKKFGDRLEHPPKVFSTNYFLKNDKGEYLNGMLDKLCWILWAEGRAHGDFEALKTPIGYIPKFEDLKMLFDQNLDKSYTKENYERQFSIRVSKLLNKLNRIEKMYKKEENIPQFFWSTIDTLKAKLNQLVSEKGEDIISPFQFK